MRSLFFSPVFNQAHELPRMLDELRSTNLACDEFMFVNNGSSDGSEDIVRRSGYKVIEIARNRGVGHSIVVAADYAMQNGFDVIGGMASNGKMLPSEMSRILDPIRAGQADYVTGSRFMNGGDSPNLPEFRRRAIPMVNHVVWATTGARVTDATCGYRAFRLDLLQRAEFDWRAEWLSTYGLEYYLYAKVILDRSVRWLEVPITMRYPPAGRYSKIRPGRDWWAMLKPWAVARLDGKGFAAHAHEAS
jgi:dolichol-phosphate mannosyltransferase